MTEVRWAVTAFKVAVTGMWHKGDAWDAGRIPNLDVRGSRTGVFSSVKVLWAVYLRCVHLSVCMLYLKKKKVGYTFW